MKTLPNIQTAVRNHRSWLTKNDNTHITKPSTGCTALL